MLNYQRYLAVFFILFFACFTLYAQHPSYCTCPECIEYKPAETTTPSVTTTAETPVTTTKTSDQRGSMYDMMGLLHAGGMKDNEKKMCPKCRTFVPIGWKKGCPRCGTAIPVTKIAVRTREKVSITSRVQIVSTIGELILTEEKALHSLRSYPENQAFKGLMDEAIKGLEKLINEIKDSKTDLSPKEVKSTLEMLDIILRNDRSAKAWFDGGRQDRLVAFLSAAIKQKNKLVEELKGDGSFLLDKLREKHGSSVPAKSIEVAVENNLSKSREEIARLDEYIKFTESLSNSECYAQGGCGNLREKIQQMKEALARLKALRDRLQKELENSRKKSAAALRERTKLEKISKAAKNRNKRANAAPDESSWVESQGERVTSHDLDLNRSESRRIYDMWKSGKITADQASQEWSKLGTSRSREELRARDRRRRDREKKSSDKTVKKTDPRITELKEQERKLLREQRTLSSQIARNDAKISEVEGKLSGLERKYRECCAYVSRRQEQDRRRRARDAAARKRREDAERRRDAARLRAEEQAEARRQRAERVAAARREREARRRRENRPDTTDGGEVYNTPTSVTIGSGIAQIGAEGTNPIKPGTGMAGAGLQLGYGLIVSWAGDAAFSAGQRLMYRREAQIVEQLADGNGFGGSGKLKWYKRGNRLWVWKVNSDGTKVLHSWPGWRTTNRDRPIDFNGRPLGGE
ncbi:hypothetical protein KAJ27_21140 [bacterium]|nr:hypothetical protein [bacterium]